jgi:hypothetical protein
MIFFFKKGVYYIQQNTVTTNNHYVLEAGESIQNTKGKGSHGIQYMYF